LHPQQQIDGQLVEALVGQPPRPQGCPLEGAGLERAGVFAAVGNRPLVAGVDLGQQGLDLGVGVPAPRLLLEDQIGEETGFPYTPA
jgi:hypothetical protein